MVKIVIYMHVSNMVDIISANTAVVSFISRSDIA